MAPRMARTLKRFFWHNTYEISFAPCACLLGNESLVVYNAFGAEGLSVVMVSRELWSGLRHQYGGALPSGPDLTLVYQDAEGDIMLLLPDVPWSHFLQAARRVFITCK